jgi:inosine-uridine nucleoside N-ribohydrolase
MHRVIIDTDLGVDDAHAVVMALMSPEIQVEGFTTVYGNARAQYCTNNVLYVLELLGKTGIPVRQGADIPLMREINFGKEHLLAKLEAAQKSESRNSSTKYRYVSPHGEKGLGDFEPPEINLSPAEGNAIAWLVETVLASPGEIEILALGPLTNIALAISIEPKWAAAVKRLIFMGGALTVPGNVAPLSTANITHDAEAAKIVFHAGIPTVMVGQDVTRFARLSPSHMDQLRLADTKVTKFLIDVTRYYAGYYFEREPSLVGVGHPIHDMLVTAYLLEPKLFRTERLYVTVETHGEVTRGQTVADWREFSPHVPQMDVCMEVNNEALFDLYLERVTQKDIPK